MESDKTKKEGVIIRFVFIGDLFGSIFSRPIPDDRTVNGYGVTNIINPVDAPTSHYTNEKYLLKGGLSKIQTRIQQIIKFGKCDQIVLLSGGSMISCSPETIFSQGQTMVKLLNELGDDEHRIEYHSPGKYDYIYGQKIFEYTFNQGSNSYDINRQMPDFVTKQHGLATYPGISLALNLSKQVHNRQEPVLLGYHIKKYLGIKIGFIGLTVDQKPSEFIHMYGKGHGNYSIDGHVVKLEINQQIIDDKLIQAVKTLKMKNKCQAIILISNFGLVGNIRLAELDQLSDNRIDLIFSTGTGEKVVIQTEKNKTLIIEPGLYGEYIALGKLVFDQNLKCIRKKTTSRLLDVGPFIEDNIDMNNKIDLILRQYYSEPIVVPRFTLCENEPETITDIFPFKSQTSNFNGLLIPNLLYGLHRHNHSTHPYFPAFIEGVSSNLIAESIRGYSKTQISIFRGYLPSMIIESKGNCSIGDTKLSYKNGYNLGSLTKGDLLYSLPQWTYLGRGYISGHKLYRIIQNSIFSELNGNIYNYKGGYLFAFGGCLITLDAKNLNDIIKGIIRGPSLVKIISIKVLSSFDRDPFNYDNYLDLDLNEYYSISGEFNLDEPYQISHIDLDAPPPSNNYKIAPIINVFNNNLSLSVSSDPSTDSLKNSMIDSDNNNNKDHINLFENTDSKNISEHKNNIRLFVNDEISNDFHKNLSNDDEFVFMNNHRSINDDTFPFLDWDLIAIRDNDQKMISIYRACCNYLEQLNDKDYFIRHLANMPHIELDDEEYYNLTVLEKINKRHKLRLPKRY